MTDESIEQETQAKVAATALVTPADIEAEIASEHYFIASDAMQTDSAVHVAPETGWFLGNTQRLTFCVLQLRNGHTVTGTAYCADPERFNAQTGRETARDDAIRQLWPMVIFAKRNQLANEVAK